MRIYANIRELALDLLQNLIDVVLFCQSKQLLAEVISIGIHHDLRKHRDKSFKKLAYELIIVLFLFDSGLQFHAFLLIPTHRIGVLNQVTEVAIMSFVDVLPIRGLLRTSTTDTAPRFVT